MSLTDIISLDSPIKIVDIGANPIDGAPPYKPLLDNQLANIIGFEPQEEAFKQLNQTASERYLPYAIGDGKEHTLYICQASGMTSLFKPNMDYLKHFHGFESWAKIINEQSVSTKRLDDIDEIDKVDFLKMDVQGSEMMILQNAEKTLKDAICIQLEVSFNSTYENIPLYGEIDTYLRGQGWILHAFQPLRKRMIAPMAIPNNPSAALNHCHQADAVYIRPFDKIETYNNEQLRKLLFISHFCFKSYDLAIFALSKIDPNLLGNYISLISSGQKAA